MYSANFRASNAARAIESAARDAAAATAALTSVTEPVHRMVLELRIAHPDKSMSELGGLCTPPMTKYAYAGHLRRLLNKRPTKAGDSNE
jgi:cell division protein WhiA